MTTRERLDQIIEDWLRNTQAPPEYLTDAFVSFVAEWLLSTGSAAAFLSERWREEMGGE